MRERGEWRGWLREQPPVWRRQEEFDDDRPRRWEREPEPFEDAGSVELYPGATVLDDLGLAEDDTATLRILARYAVARVVILVAAELLTGPKLRSERRIAAEHVRLLPGHDWERHALERLLARCGDGRLDPALVDALIVAAESAAKREHIMGAYGLYRAAWDASLTRSWWREASSAARGIGRLARLEEARYSARLWDRRAAVLERRAARTDAEPE